MPDGLGNSEQVRAIADQVGLAAASAAIREFVSQHPHFAPPPPKPEIPAPIKWAAIIISGLLTVGVSGACFWVVTTLDQLQDTVARIDERQLQDTTGKRLDAVELVNAEQTERLAALEQGKRK